MAAMLGITGAIGSGKTALATMLQRVQPSSAHYDSGQLVAEIADVFNKALKAELAFETTTKDIELVNQVLIWLPDAISERLHHEVVWNQLAITKRDTLAHPELYEKLFAYLALVHKTPHLTDGRVTDKTKEAYRPLLQWLGGYMVAKISKTIWYDELIRRIDERETDKSLVIVTGVRYPSDAQVIRRREDALIVRITRPAVTDDSTDVTESQRQTIKPDITITNSGTLDDLERCAEQLWNDIASGSQKAHYVARG